MGGFGATLAGSAIESSRWPGLRSAQLVQLLALADGHRLAREQVIEALWPQLDPDAGAANLRKAAHHARQALGRQDAVVLHGGQVQLMPALPVQVDARIFERRARAALDAGDPGACAEVARTWGGELLPAARYEAWSEPARERLLALQAALLRTAGDWVALAELDPTDEPAHRELMAVALAQGNRTAAIRWYARLRRALLETLGVAPAAETQAMYRRATDGLAQPRRGPALIGRAMVRAQLEAWLLAAPRQRPGAVLVTGPGGIGKTALGRELAADARAAGWWVVTVTAVLPGRPHAAMAALTEELLQSRRDLLDAIGSAARSVLALLTPLAEPADARAAPMGRHQVVGALRRLLLAAAGNQPLLLQLDDAHLIDDAEVDIVLQLASAGPPISVWLAAREPAPPSALARGAARMAASGRLERIELGPLDQQDLRVLVEQTAASPLADDTVQRILKLADGNPFVALELARGIGAPAGRLPASVAEAITERLVDVPDAALDLLRRLALANDAVDAAMAVALSPGGEAATFAVLDAALQHGTLVVDDTNYRFRHELVRQALVDQVTPHRRLRLHRDIAQALAELEVPPALVARHWLAGGSVRAAVPWLLAAAQAALQTAAFSEVLRHTAPVLAHEPGHAEALRLRAEALDAQGDPEAVAAWRAAADAVGGPLADDLRARAALAQIKQGDPKGGVQALQGLAPSTDEGRLVEALAYSGAAALGAIDPAIGSAKSAEARRLALASGNRAALVIASWAHAAAAHARGELHRTVQADLHDTHQLPHLATRVFDGQLCMVQRFLYGARPYAEVIGFAQALADEARRLGSPRGEAFGITIRGEAELLSGDLDRAERHLWLGRDQHAAIGAATGESFCWQRLAEVSMARGRLDEARDRLDQALDLARQSDVGFHLLDRIYGTRIALADLQGDGRGALDEAIEAVRGPLETCPGCRITFVVPAAIAAARAGDLDRAEDLLSQSAYLADVVMRLPAWHAAEREVRGHLAEARGSSAATVVAHFATAEAQFRAAGQPLDAQRCKEHARRFSSRGRKTQA